MTTPMMECPECGDSPIEVQGFEWCCICGGAGELPVLTEELLNVPTFTEGDPGDEAVRK